MSDIKVRLSAMRKRYLVTTDHLESRIWFRDDDDFVVGMNHVAIQAFLTKVTVLAFILMSNHVHFVLYGTWEECEAFIDNFKARYSQYLFRKYGIREQLRRNDFEIKELPYDDEAFEKAVAYTNMNCVAANICLYANQYPWGTGDCFFNPSRPVGKRLSDFSKRNSSVSFTVTSRICRPIGSSERGASSCPSVMSMSNMWKSSSVSLAA